MEDRIDWLFNVLDRVSAWGTLVVGALALGYVIPRLLP